MLYLNTQMKKRMNKLYSLKLYINMIDYLWENCQPALFYLIISIITNILLYYYEYMGITRLTINILFMVVIYYSYVWSCENDPTIAQISIAIIIFITIYMLFYVCRNDENQCSNLLGLAFYNKSKN
jgi:hypothetical protein